LKLIDVIIQQQ